MRKEHEDESPPEDGRLDEIDLEFYLDTIGG